MSAAPPDLRNGASSSRSQGLIATAVGVAGLAVVVLLLPFLGDGGLWFAGMALSYALVLVPAGLLVLGFLAVASDLPTPRVLLLGATTGLLGVAATLLGGRPEALAEGPAPLPLALLLLSDVSRICAACALALALSRHVNSLGVAYLIAAVATTADVFSVLAGPTNTLVREDSPALDFLLIILPTFGHALGFALGVADFVFLALFAAIAQNLALRPLATLSAGCMAAFIAMLAGLIAESPLPALPFISASFALVNADLALGNLAKMLRP